MLQANHVETFTIEQSAAAAVFYREHGYMVIKNVFSADEIAEAHEASDRIKTAIESGALQNRGNVLCFRDQDCGLARAAFWVSQLDQRLDALRTDQRVHKILKPLIGSSMRQLTNQFHWKPPGSSVSINFHTDRVNRKPDQDFRDLGNSFVQFAISIDPMTQDNGPLLIIPGSHRSYEEIREAEGNYGNGHPSRDILSQRGYSEEDLVAIISEPGDVVCWHPDTIHGSDQNTSEIDRCIYINGYIKASSTHRGHWAFIKGQSIPVPELDVPLPVSPNSCDEDWIRRFPLD